MVMGRGVCARMHAWSWGEGGVRACMHGHGERGACAHVCATH